MADFRPGRLDGGFNLIARDLDRAFSVAKFSSVQNLLIQQARELSWMKAKIVGSPKAIPFCPNLSDLSRCTGFHRVNLTQCFAELVTFRVFLALEDKTYLINKDYRQWLDSEGKQRLSLGQIAWCRKSMRDREDGNNCSRSATSDNSHNVADRLHPPVADRLQAPLKGTRAESFNSEKEKTCVLSEHPPEFAGADVGKNGPLVLQPIPHPCNDPAEVTRIGEYAIKLFGALDAGPKVSGYAYMYPIAWIREALETASAVGKLRWDYIVGILRRFERDGGPAPAATHAPTVSNGRPLSRQERQVAEFKRLADESKLKREIDKNGDC